jgi:hypothetical protein
LAFGGRKTEKIYCYIALAIEELPFTGPPIVMHMMCAGNAAPDIHLVFIASAKGNLLIARSVLI